MIFHCLVGSLCRGRFGGVGGRFLSLLPRPASTPWLGVRLHLPLSMAWSPSGNIRSLPPSASAWRQYAFAAFLPHLLFSSAVPGKWWQAAAWPAQHCCPSVTRPPFATAKSLTTQSPTGALTIGSPSRSLYLRLVTHSNAASVACLWRRGTPWPLLELVTQEQ